MRPTDLLTILSEWLDDPDPARQLHARNRLALLGGAEPAPAPLPTPAFVLSVLQRARSCPHYGPGASCCDGARCALDRSGRGWISPTTDCLACPDLPGGNPERSEAPA